MAIPKFDADLNIISSLGDYPREDDGLEPEDFKKRFDIAGNLLKQYINEVLVPNLDAIVDVDALLKSILDPTMTGADMAAQAKAVGLRLNARRAEVGSILEKAYLGGDFAIPTTENFQAYFSGDNSVVVRRGACIMQGNLIELPAGYSTTLNFQSGLGGTYRSDLICLRVTRDQDGNDTSSIVLIPGAESISGFADPKYNTGDLNSGAAVRDFPIYRLKMDGGSASLEQLFCAASSRTILLPASGWVGASAPYTQTVTAAGLADGRRIMVYPVYGENTASNIAMKEACSSVSYAKRDGAGITFVCLEDKPDVDITVAAEVYV